MIENLSITSENVSPDTPASARISDVDGHKNIHFLLRQGATGAPYLIKGRAYATVEELESSITSPAIGDQYNVGTAAPYNIYRWTGSTWEDQGKIGINFQNLTDAEIDSIWNGTAVSSTSSKYIDHSGLFHLIVDRIKAAFTTKVDKVEGKGLSTNDFTNEYVSQISTHDSQLSSLANLKVDKVTGKGLSTNDFTNEYKNLVNHVNSLAGTDTLETDAQTLTGAVNEVNTLVGGLDDLTDILTHHGAGLHNALYRGKYLGDSLTAAQSAAIRAGTFGDLYIGDYWTIGGVNYRIADFDYFYRAGDQECTTHHVVIVPDTNLDSQKMNDTNVITGGYTGSKMYTDYMATAKNKIIAAFGSGHILGHREYLTNAVANGRPSGGAWFNSTIELMSEAMCYGGTFFEPVSDGSTVPNKYSVACKQLNLFRHRPDMISNRQTFWLRNVVSAAYFAYVTADGVAFCYGASISLGVRPAFPIY